MIMLDHFRALASSNAASTASMGNIGNRDTTGNLDSITGAVEGLWLEEQDLRAVLVDDRNQL